jgi:hypothetical protein
VPDAQELKQHDFGLGIFYNPKPQSHLEDRPTKEYPGVVRGSFVPLLGRLSCGKPIIPQSATFDPEFLPLLALYQKILNDFAGLPRGAGVSSHRALRRSEPVILDVNVCTISVFM